MKPPSPLLLPAGLILTCFLAPYFFFVIVAENDNTTVHPNGCGERQTGRKAANKVYINSGAFPSSPYDADLYSLPLSRLPITLVVNPPDTPAPILVA